LLAVIFANEYAVMAAAKLSVWIFHALACLGVKFSPLRHGVALTRHSFMSGEELIQACADSNDGEAWEEFIGRFRRPISLSILRIAHQWGGTPQQLVDDLVQETYLKLCADKCRLLLRFASQHPEAVNGYIKAIAVNVAHDHFKSLHSQKRGLGEAAQLSEDVEPHAQSGDLGGQGAMERQVLLGQIDRCLETCSEGSERERDRLIFWLYYQQGMSAKAIAALPTVGLTAKGVESALFRLTRLVREQIVGLRSQTSISQQPGEKGFRPAESY
jgi:RNA polymerase sigma-70 factor, ECF subfamily